MSIEISRETEMRVTVEAERLGISVDALLKRFIDEHAALLQTISEISGWVATVAGTLALLVGWIPIVGQALAAVLGTVALAASILTFLSDALLKLGGVAGVARTG